MKVMDFTEFIERFFMEDKRMSEITTGSLAFAAQMAYVEDAHGTHKFLENFNVLYRYITKDAGIVTLESEISALNYFIEIQRMRFGNKFEVEISEIGDLSPVYIDKMALLDFFDKIIQDYIEDTEGYVNINFDFHITAGRLETVIKLKSEIQTEMIKRYVEIR